MNVGPSVVQPLDEPTLFELPPAVPAVPAPARPSPQRSARLREPDHALVDYLALVDRLTAPGDAGKYPFVRGRLLWRDGVPHTRVKATVGAFSADLAAAPPGDPGGAVKTSDPLIFDRMATMNQEAPAFAPCAVLVLPRAHAVAIWLQLTDDVRSSGLAAHLPDGASVVVVARGTLPLSPIGDGAVMIALRPKIADEVTARRVTAALRRLGARALSLGARLYLIGDDPDDVRWTRHQYADAWPAWSALKDRLDPDQLGHPWRL